MLYPLIKIAVRIALKIFCRKIKIQNRGLLQTGGPLLITANHPNSFLDAIIIGSQFEQPVHFLARGDAFNKRWHNTMLRLLNMIPVYRLSEGKENLFLNEDAFRRSKEILSAGGIVLIFIEGICVHKHELQPFKKGAARIATDSKSLPEFCIIPLGIAYQSFNRFGKTINIRIGEPVPISRLLPFEDEAKNMRYFNEKIYHKIEGLIDVPSINPSVNKTKRQFYFLPGLIGFLLHQPLYAVLKNKIRKKTKGTVFFDSVLFGALLVLYPAYLLLVAILLIFMQVPALFVIIILLIHPLTAFCAVRLNAEREGYSGEIESDPVTLSS